MITLIRLQAHNFKGLRDVDITFPSQGSILIEGHNEAGKSTLFEAVYVALYGNGLVGEDTTPRLEDMVAFGAAKASVELTFAHGDTRVQVARQFRRNKAGDIQHVPSVTVYAADGTEETRHGVNAVNSRILTELGNLDGSALRNSCFVEQKELGRLESLDRSAREKAIERLLGLEQLANIATAYQRERKQFETELKKAEQNRDLARAYAAVEQHRQGIIDAQELITVARVVEGLDRLDAARDEDQQLIAALASATQRRNIARERITLADQCTAWLRDNEQVVTIAEMIQSRRQMLKESVTARQQQRDELLTRSIPEQETVLVQYQLVQSAIEDAARIDSEVEDARTNDERTTHRHDALLIATQDLQEAEHTATIASEAIINANIVVRDAEIRDALTEWLHTVNASSTATNTVANIHDQVVQVRGQYSAAQQRLLSLKSQQRQRLIIGGIGITVGILFIGVGILTHLFVPLMLAGIVVAIASVLPLVLLRQGMTDAMSTEAALRQSLQVAEARQDAISGATIVQPAAILTRLENLGVGKIGQPEAQTLLADLQQRVTVTLKEATDIAQEARIHAAAAQIHVDNARKQLQSIAPMEESGPLRPELVAQGQRETTRTLLRNAEAHQQRSQATLQSALATAALPMTTDALAIRGIIAKAESKLESLQQQSHQLIESDDTLQQEIIAALTDLLTQWQGLVSRAIAMNIITESPNEATTEADILKRQPQLRTAVVAQLQQCNKDQAVAQLEAELNAIGGYRNRQEQIQGEMNTARWQIAEIVQERGIAQLPATLIREFCVQNWPELVNAPTLSQTEAEKHQADIRSYAAKEYLDRLIHETSVPEATVETLDVATTVAEVTSLQRKVAISERALRLVNAVRQRIVKMVLPTTERNMRIILPLLTAGRYHDVQLTAPTDEESDHADYRIYVYESTAGRLVSKSIFSGGARDQCSLALRLAFALATLPQELGIAPGFLFLDEPLSAFDSERAAALVQLLTQGEIARAFAQVVVISHQNAFARHDFQYHIRMERGRVVASDLPKSTPSVLVS